MSRPDEYSNLRSLQVFVITSNEKYDVELDVFALAYFTKDYLLLHISHYLSALFANQFPRRPIEERVVTALGKHWHIEHFACAKVACGYFYIFAGANVACSILLIAPRWPALYF